MDRNDKIRILEAIANGNLLPEDFRSPKQWIFIEDSGCSGIYYCNGKRYDQEQQKAFNEMFDRGNERRALIPGLLPDCMMIVFSSLPYDLPKPAPVTTVQAEPDPDPDPVEVNTEPPEVKEVTEDIPAVIETAKPETKNKVKPDKIVNPGQRTFNLQGEERDRQRAAKMDAFNNLQNKLYED
ncbi:MAG: hypothetical protein JNK14_09105 [Chitinophagaceae bacterium]|nr:hypothetical protein [Chitinophagaceae bacterium]